MEEEQKNDSKAKISMTVGDLVRYTGWKPKINMNIPWFVDTCGDNEYQGLIGIIVAELPYNTDLFIEYGIPDTFFGKWFIVMGSDGTQEPFTSEDLELFTENT